MESNSQDQSYLEKHYESGGEDRPDRITIPSDAWSEEPERIDEQPLHMKAIETSLSIIKGQVSTEFFKEYLKKYYDVVKRCSLFQYDWSNDGEGDIRAYAGKDDSYTVLFILERKGFYNELKEVCFGKYGLDENKNRVIDVEYWVNLKEYRKKLPFNPLFPWEPPED
ncbi:MAG: hypothetical protein ABIC57_00660 [bacterium]